MNDKMMFEQLTMTIERKVFHDEIKALEKQFRSLSERIKNSEMVGDSISSMQIVIQDNINEMKKVLKSKGLL